MEFLHEKLSQGFVFSVGSLQVSVGRHHGANYKHLKTNGLLKSLKNHAQNIISVHSIILIAQRVYLNWGFHKQKS